MSIEARTASLLEQCQTGDENAFGDLLALHYDRMYSIAWRWCGDQINAQDITQNACLKLAKNIQQYDGNSSFNTWLYRLTINCAKDFYKSPTQHNRREESHQELDYLSADNASIESRIGAQQMLLKIGDLATDLTDTLLLVFVQGLSHQQAAEQLGIQASTVSWRVHEARKQLRLLLEAPAASAPSDKPIKGLAENELGKEAQRGQP